MNYENFELHEFTPSAQEFEAESYEMEMAYELLNTENEAELNHFLGGLVKKAWSGVKSLYNSPAGQALKGQIIANAKSLGRRALPSLANKVGRYVGGDTGAQLGDRFSNWATNRYLNEYETGEPSEQDVAAARGIVRMTDQAARQVADMVQSGQSVGRQAGREAVLANAGHLQGAAHGNHTSAKQSGTWHRRGNKIILSGI